MRTQIPGALLAVCSDIVAKREQTHARLNSLFMSAGAPGEPPSGGMHPKAQEWLRRLNKDDSIQPLVVLGKIIEVYMDEEIVSNGCWSEEKLRDRDRIHKALANANLGYVKGGLIVGSVTTPSRTLEEFIREKNTAAIESEFRRAIENVESNPREAASAASNILESVFKAYIEDEGLEMPARQDLQPVWTIVRKHIGFDPSAVEDEDLRKILSGLISTVDGIGALRTHASSAHGAGKKCYRLEARHARLAVHAAHTVALFVLESWDKKKQTLS